MKKQVLKLNIDDLGDDSEGLAYLFFHTTTPGYLFVDDLNHLYGLSLSRLDDLQLEGQSWPLYSYHDNLRQLDYYLIERPTGAIATATHWAPGHKMMILKGEGAADTAEHISNDFATPPPRPTCLPGTDGDSSYELCGVNPAEVERYNILTSYQQAFTPVNLYDLNAPTSTSKKVLKERTEIENLFTAILDLLDLSGME